MGYSQGTDTPDVVDRLRDRRGPGLRGAVGRFVNTVEGAQWAIQLRTICGALNAAALTWLFAGIVGVRARPYIWLITATMLAVVAVIVLGIPVLDARVTGIERVLLPWGESFLRSNAPRRAP